VRFAAERTLLAWIRTGLALMGFGFVVARFGLFLQRLAFIEGASPPHSYGWSLWLGMALVVLGIAVTVLAAVEHRRIIRQLDQGESFHPPRWSLGLVVAFTLAIFGAAMVAYLLFVGS
jgi:putative membrane protein